LKGKFSRAKTRRGLRQNSRLKKTFELKKARGGRLGRKCNKRKNREERELKKKKKKPLLGGKVPKRDPPSEEKKTQTEIKREKY